MPLTIMDDDKRKKENLAIIDRLQSNSDALDKTAKDLQLRTRRTFQAIEAMSWLTFAVGLVLVGFSLAYYAFVHQTPEVLGLTGLGLADFVALFFYKPMDRIQIANASFDQQAMILNTWATTINLQLLSMDVNDPESVARTSQNIQSETLKSLQEIYDYIEGHKSDGKTPKVSNATTPAAVTTT